MINIHTKSVILASGNDAEGSERVKIGKKIKKHKPLEILCVKYQVNSKKREVRIRNNLVVRLLTSL